MRIPGVPGVGLIGSAVPVPDTGGGGDDTSQDLAVTVPAGADAWANGVLLQAALDGAVGGDTIVLSRDGDYWVDGSFQCPENLSGLDITVRTSAALPATTTRLDLPTDATRLTRVWTTGNQTPVLGFQAGASHWVWRGIDFGCAPPGGQTDNTPQLLNVGATDPYNSGANFTWAQKVATQGIRFEQCFIHPPECTAASPDNDTLYTSVSYAMQAECGVTVQGCVFKGFGPLEAYGSHATATSVGVLSVAGAGPLVIENCELEAHFNPAFLGGGDSSPEHTATVTASSLSGSSGTVTLSDVTGLVEGEAIALDTGFRTVDGLGLQFWSWVTGIVTGISGSDVDFDVVDHPGYDTATHEPVAGVAYWHSDASTYQRGTISAIGSGVFDSDNVTGLSAGVRMLVPSYDGNVGTIYMYVEVTGVAGATVSWTKVSVGYSQFKVAPLVGSTAGWGDGYFGPRDVLLSQSVIHNRAAWASSRQMKAWMEVKAVDGLIIDGCVFLCYPYYYSGDGRYIGGEVGFPQYNQNGSAPWTQVRHVSVTNSIFMGMKDGAFTVQASDPYNVTAAVAEDFTFSNLLLMDNPDPDFQAYPTASGVLRSTSPDPATQKVLAVTLDHVTAINTYNINGVIDGPLVNFTFKNSIVRHGLYGHHCSHSNDPTNTQCFPSGEWKYLLLLDPDSAVSSYGPYGPGPNTVLDGVDWADDDSRVGFRNQAIHDYRLLASSDGYQAGNDGQDLGANFTTLYAALNPVDWPFSWIP